MPKLSDKEIETAIYESNGFNYKHDFDPHSPYYFENFCGACDNIGTDGCPFHIAMNEAGCNTRHELLGCKNFWD